MDFIRRYKRGFTLVELIIVISIVAIIATVGYTRWIRQATLTISAQADLLANDIRYAQNLSMSRAQHFQFVLNSPSTNNYQILDGSGNAVILSSGYPSNALSSGISFSSIVNLPESKIVFDGLGKPYSDAATAQPLTSTASITIVSGNQTKTIVIVPETGRVDVQ